MPGGQCPSGTGSCPGGGKILRAVVTRRKLQNAQPSYLLCRRIVVASQLTDFFKERKPGQLPSTQCIPCESLAVGGEMVRRLPAMGISRTAPIAGPKAQGRSCQQILARGLATQSGGIGRSSWRRMAPSSGGRPAGIAGDMAGVFC